MVIKFGVKTGQGGYDYQTLRKIWIEGERLGFDSAWLYDHFIALGDKEAPCLESWTTLSALATETKTIRIGTMVTCYSYRYPSILAKMASTIDVISNGRLDFGIGAGWYEEEHRMYGYEFPSASVRVTQLKEAVEIIRRMWTEDKTTFEGRHYSIKEAVNLPKPIQKPHPPIWIGISKGRQLMPKLAASFADAINIPSLSPYECKQILDSLRLECQRIGRNYDSILKSWQGFIIIAENYDELKDLVRDAASKRGEKPEQYLESVRQRGVIAGSPDDCIADLERYVEEGFEYLLLIFHGDESIKPLETFAKKVAPHFRRR